jgi:hypothetical protein
MSKWQMTRLQYSFGLGILVATWIHFPAPRALFVFVITSALTALRFRTLGWNPWKAFLPAAIAVVGTALTVIVGHQTGQPKDITHIWRGAAVIAQLGMTVRAILANSKVDPTSPRQALALDFLKQRRQTKQSMNRFQPQIEAHRRAMEKLDALKEELARHIAENGQTVSAERLRLTEEVADQTLLVRASSEDLRATTLKIREQTEALRSATEAWKNRNNRAA